MLAVTSADLITELAGGANLVFGKQTWEHAQDNKGNLEIMLMCCEAEIETMKQAKLVAAPFYFERAAILYRKARQYEKEIAICMRYTEAVEKYYSTVAQGHEADVRNGPTYAAIQARLAKARELVARTRNAA
jgi:hypothetical protein